MPPAAGRRPPNQLEGCQLCPPRRRRPHRGGLPRRRAGRITKYHHDHSRPPGSRPGPGLTTHWQLPGAIAAGWAAGCRLSAALADLRSNPPWRRQAWSGDSDDTVADGAAHDCRTNLRTADRRLGNSPAGQTGPASD